MIRFPKEHIATSVVRRIEAVARRANPPADRLTVGDLFGAANPIVPQPAAQGAALDAQLQQPTPPVGELGGPDSDTANAAEAVLSGGSSLQGLLDKVSGR